MVLELGFDGLRSGYVVAELLVGGLEADMLSGVGDAFTKNPRWNAAWGRLKELANGVNLADGSSVGGSAPGGGRSKGKPGEEQQNAGGSESPLAALEPIATDSLRRVGGFVGNGAPVYAPMVEEQKRTVRLLEKANENQRELVQTVRGLEMGWV